MNLTTAELLDAIRDALAQRPAQDGITTAEIADALAMSQPTARKHIAAMVKAGTLRPVKVIRDRMDGMATRVTGWELAR